MIVVVELELLVIKMLVVFTKLLFPSIHDIILLYEIIIGILYILI